MSRLDDIRKRSNAATPGPWQWDMRHKSGITQLVTAHSGRYYVMGVERWGMQNACPTFQVYEKYSGPVRERHSKGMVRADQLATPIPGKEHHFGFEDHINHPDAVFIEHSKDDVEWLLTTIDSLTKDRDALCDIIKYMLPILEAEADFHGTTGYVVTRDNLRGLCESARAALKGDSTNENNQLSE